MARYWSGAATATNSNWNANVAGVTNWGTASGVADNASAPTVADDVFFDGAGVLGNTSSIITATISCKSLTISAGYTQTMTHNAVLTVAGSITLHTGYTIAGSSAITVSATGTITSNGKTWPNSFNAQASPTITLVGDFIVLGTLTAISINGTVVINKTTTEKITVGGLNTSNTNASINGTALIVINNGTWQSSSAVVNGIFSSVTIDCTVNNVTVSGLVFYSTGTLSYISGAGSVTTTGSTLQFTGASTLDTNGITWNNITLNAGTFTINSLLSFTGTFTILLSGGFAIFAGTAGFSGTTFICSSAAGGTISLKESITYTITSSFTCNQSRVGNTVLVTSSHASTKANLLMPNNGNNTCNVNASFTRIDASGGRSINTFNGVCTDVINIREFHDRQTFAS